MIIVIIILSIVIVFLTVYIALAPIGECPECIHCRWKRIQDKERQQQTQKDFEHEFFINPERCGCEKCKERIRRRNSG